jgi:predicted nucleic acid-binding protein
VDRVVLDSGAVSALAERSVRALALLEALRDVGTLPRVPTVVLVESLRGDARRDAPTHRFLRMCEIVEGVPFGLARRAAELRARARRGSAVDALVVAMAEPNGVVLTSDVGDLTALATHADRVRVERV